MTSPPSTSRSRKPQTASASTSVSVSVSADLQTEPATAASPDVVDRRALLGILLAVALATLDTAICNTALPTMAVDLQTTPAASIWIVNAFQLAVVAALLPSAALAEVLGPRRVFIGGLLFFTAASAACALSQTLAQLTAARALQGLGAAALMSTNIALIRLVFPARHLGRGVGLNALVVGVAFGIGPTLASVVLSVASWPWLFAINVPLGLLCFAVGRPALPRPVFAPGQPRPRFDTVAALLSALCFASLIFALGEGGQRASAGAIAGALALSLLAGTLLARRDRNQPTPMLPLDLMRRPAFALSALTSYASFATQGLAFVGLPFFFEHSLQRDAIETGFLMTPWALLVAACAPWAGRLSERHAPGLLGGIGLALLACGMASLALLAPADAGSSASASAWGIGLRMALCGLGFALFQAPNMKALMSSAPPARSGGASAVIALARLLGQASGAALVALCFGLAGDAGPQWALWLGAAFACLAAVASSARLWVRAA